MLCIPVAERRARIGRRHRLALSCRADDPVEVARDLVALHSTDAPTVYLSALARMNRGGLADIEQALYTDRSLVRVMGMRRTVFVVPVELAPVVIAACGRSIAVRERRTLTELLNKSEAAIDDVEGWLEGAEAAALEAVAELGIAAASDVAASDPRLGLQLVLAHGKRYEGVQKVCSRMLVYLAAEGKIVRTRPVGTWRSSQYRWSTMPAWCGQELPEWDEEAARVELARCYLASFGPATVEDLRWWTGWTIQAARKALAQLPVAEVDLEGMPGVVLENDLELAGEAEPWAALLPALDSTPMGWARRGWYLGPHQQQLFDNTGNVGPTVWLNGRIVGGWAQRKDGEIVYKMLEDAGTEAASMIEAAAEKLAQYLDRTPLGLRARAASQVERDLTR